LMITKMTTMTMRCIIKIKQHLQLINYSMNYERTTNSKTMKEGTLHIYQYCFKFNDEVTSEYSYFP